MAVIEKRSERFFTKEDATKNLYHLLSRQVEVVIQKKDGTRRTLKGELGFNEALDCFRVMEKADKPDMLFDSQPNWKNINANRVYEITEIATGIRIYPKHPL